MKQKPTQNVKAFYNNMNLVKLFPIFNPEFEIELGGN